MLALFNDKSLFVMHFIGDVFFFLGFHVNWGSVLEPLLED